MKKVQTWKEKIEGLSRVGIGNPKDIVLNEGRTAIATHMVVNSRCLGKVHWLLDLFFILSLTHQKTNCNPLHTTKPIKRMTCFFVI